MPSAAPAAPSSGKLAMRSSPAFVPSPTLGARWTGREAKSVFVVRNAQADCNQLANCFWPGDWPELVHSRPPVNCLEHLWCKPNHYWGRIGCRTASPRFSNIIYCARHYLSILKKSARRKAGTLAPGLTRTTEYPDGTSCPRD